MEPTRPGRRHNLVLANTSDIHAFGVALQRHADDLGSAAANLSAARVAADAFGPAGAHFASALNDALTREAEWTATLADRLVAATSVAASTADAYRSAEDTAGQSISRLDV